MKNYLILLITVLLLVACKRKEKLEYVNFCKTAADHPTIREAFVVNGIDSVFTKNGVDRSHGNVTDTFINFWHEYVDQHCQSHFMMGFGRINKYLIGKQIVYKPYTCNNQIPGECNSIGFFSTIDVDNLFEGFEIFEGADPSQNWVEINSLTNERIKGSYHATFLRNNHKINNNSSFMQLDTLHISGNFDIPNPQ